MPQRSSWVRTDPKISPASMGKPGFGLAWKIKLPGEPALASILDRYIGYCGFRSYAFVGSRRESWNSGKTMTAPVRESGISGSGSQIYLGTSDGTVYAFGFPTEH